MAPNITPIVSSRSRGRPGITASSSRCLPAPKDRATSTASGTSLPRACAGASTTPRACGCGPATTTTPRRRAIPPATPTADGYGCGSKDGLPLPQSGRERRRHPRSPGMFSTRTVLPNCGAPAADLRSAEFRRRRPARLRAQLPGCPRWAGGVRSFLTPAEEAVYGRFSGPPDQAGLEQFKPCSALASGLRPR